MTSFFKESCFFFWWTLNNAFSNEEWPLAEHLLKEGLKAAPPCEPFVARALRGELLVVYARIVESLRELGYAHMLLGATAYEEVAQQTVDTGAVF